MTELDWDRVEPLLERLLELPPAERAAYLEEELPNDPGLRARVLRMLKRDEADMGFLSSGPQSSEPRVVGSYRLLRRLGSGGMGEVWLGERQDGAYDGGVAVKLLQHGLTTRQHRRRFHAERQVLAWLDHPNIARLFDGGLHTDGRPFLVMQYVEGVTLDAYCRAEKPNLSQRLEIFEQVCEAVEHAHERGVVHRDLKPSNVLVDARGIPRLVDFGIAKVFGDDSGRETFELTLTGQRLFSPWYASPEQVRGEPVGPTTDVYSLGVLLFELLTDERPYDAGTPSLAELERVVCETRPARPSDRVVERTLRRSLRGDLDWIVATAMRKEPARRYADAGELLADVRRHRRGERVLARPDALGYRAATFVRRYRALVAGALIVVIVLVAALVVVSHALGRSQDAEREARATAYAAHLQSAEAAIRGGAVAVARRELETAPADLRGWEWRLLAARLDRSLVEATLGFSSGTTEGLCFSPDGAQIAIGGSTAVSLVDATNLQLLRSVPLLDGADLVLDVHAGQLAFHPAGEELAVACADGYVRVFRTRDLELLRELYLDGAACGGVLYGPGGEWMAAASVSGLLRAFRHPDYAVTAEYQGGENLRVSLAVNADGDRLASAGWDEQVHLFRAPELDPVRTLRGHEMAVWDVEFLPDGRMVSSSLDGTIRVWSPQLEQAQEVLRLMPGLPAALALDPVAGHVLASDELGNILRWDPATGRSRAWLRGHEGSVTALAYSPDGSRIVSGDGYASSVRLWARDTQDVPEFSVCEFSRLPIARGARIAVLQPDGRIRRWTWPQMEALEEVAVAGEPLIGGGFLSDANALICASESGDVFRVDLGTGAVEELYSGLGRLADFCVRGDGRAAVALERSGLDEQARVMLLDPTKRREPREVTCPTCGVPRRGSRVLNSTWRGEGLWFVDRAGHVLEHDIRAATTTVRAEVEFDDRLLPLLPPEGEFVYGVENGTLQARSLETGDLVWECNEHENLSALRLHPDGARLLAGTKTGRILVIDQRDGRLLVSLGGHRSGVLGLCFAEGTDTLLSTARDGTLRVWRMD